MNALLRYLDEERASFAQERLWLLQQLDPQDCAYNLVIPIPLPEGTEPDILRSAMADMAERHDSLRTVFEDRDGVPYQCIARKLDLPIPEVDLSPIPERERDETLRQLIAEQAAIPFDLETGPLLRCHYLRIRAREALALFTLHHIIADGWSMNILGRDLAEFCTSRRDGRSPTLPPLDYQYVHFSAWQRQQVEDPSTKGHLDYWLEQLSGAPPVLELPLDRARTNTPDAHGGTWVLHLPAELRDGLNALARLEQATLYMTLLAGFQALLFRLTGQPDIVIASPVSVRPRAEFDEIFGCFLNNVLVRSRPDRETSFRSFMQDIRRTTLDAFAHQDIPLELLIEALKPQRTRSYNPLFQSMFVLQNMPPLADGPADPQVWSAAIDGPGPDVNAKFELSMVLWETPGGITASIEYRKDLFDEATIAAIASSYRSLLTDAVRNPDLRLGSLQLLEAHVQQRMLQDWNNVPLDYPDDATIHGLFEQWAVHQPEATAVIFEGQAHSYRELNEAANRLAHRLIALGAGPEATVAILAEQSWEMLVALLGVLKSGSAYVPIDPTLPVNRIGHLVASVDPRAIVTLARHHDLLEQGTVPVIALDTDDGGGSADNPTVAVTPRNLAYVIFTSGSTGLPKGVEVEHRSVIHHLWGMREQYAVTAADRFLQKHPFNFDVSVWEFFLPLATGGSTVMVRPGGQRDIAYLIDLIADHGVTIVCFLPSVLQILLEEAAVERLNGSVRWMLCGAEAMARHVPSRFFERLNGRLHNLYGPTETTVHNTWYECHPGEQSPVIPIGRPMPGVRTYILDQDMMPLPVGVAGEIHIGGAAVTRGYRNSPDLTKSKFVPDPFCDGPDARVYKTGDIGRFRADGNIEFIGRRDQQIKIRGFRVELGEILHVLRQHDGVRDGAVVVREDAPGERRIVAYLLPGSTDLSEASLREHARLNLPQHMIPSAFVFMDSLPLRANDKFDPDALPAPDLYRQQSGPVPETSIEIELAAIWNGLLTNPVESVSDDFFDLGGHSLLAARLAAHIRSRLRVALPVRAIFENPTLEAMARAIATAPPVADDLRSQLDRPNRQV